MAVETITRNAAPDEPFVEQREEHE